MNRIIEKMAEKQLAGIRKEFEEGLKYGEVILRYDNGKITYIKKTETIKANS